MKKLLAVLLSYVVLISGSNIVNVRAESEYIKGFKKTDTYTDAKFTDVGKEWYADSVKSAYETGLMKGVGETTFNPNGQLSNAEAVTIAARIHKIYNTGKDDFQPSTPWYQTYLDYAVSNGICDNNFTPSDKATRAFFIGIFANAIDSSILTVKNDIKDGSLWDVTGWYQDAVYKMYRAGILSGNDKYGTFAPNSNITRAEVSAIAVRAVKPSSRTNVSIAERPTYTIDAPMEGDSIENFRQRAIVANLKWLLNGEPQGEEWQNDVYREKITVTNKVLDTVFLPLPQVVLYPVHYSMIVDGNTEWEVDGKKYFIELDQDGIIDYGDGDPLVWGVPNEVICKYEIVQQQEEKIYTYSDYTDVAESLIRHAQGHSVPKTSDEKIKTIVSKTLGNIGEYNYDTGLLSAYGEEKWLFTGSRSSYSIYPGKDAEYIEWWKQHNGKYIVIITRPLEYDQPIMMIEMSMTTKGWKYDGKELMMYFDENAELKDSIVNREMIKNKTR